MPRRTRTHEHERRRRRPSRLGPALLLATLGLLMAVVPAAATNGSVWTTLPSMPTARSALGGVSAPCPAGQTGTCVYAVGGSGSGPVGTLESYNRLTNAWSTLPSMPTARNAPAAAAAPCPQGQSGTCLYAVGGEVAGTPSNVVESYNPATNAWSTDAVMPTARENLAGAAAPCPAGQTGTCVYAIGGLVAGGTGVIRSNVVESYNPATNAWSTDAPLATPRAQSAAAAAPCPAGQSGTCVYAVGGRTTDSGTVGTVESYNPATNTWIPRAALPTPRFALAAAGAPCPPGQSGNCVYTAGGTGPSPSSASTVESYNPASNFWTTLPSLPTARPAAAAAATQCPPGETGTCVYVMGGLGSSGPLGTLEALDPPNADGPHRGHAFHLR